MRSDYSRWFCYDCNYSWLNQKEEFRFTCSKCKTFGNRIPPNKRVGPELTSMYYALDLIHNLQDQYPETWNDLQRRLQKSSKKRITPNRIRFHVALYVAKSIDEFRGLTEVI